MLGASCPVEDCYTPLMRNKKGQMYCVRCDQYVVTEEEAKKQAEQEAEELAAAEKEEAEDEARYEEERRRQIEQQFRLEEQAKQAREMQELEKAKTQRAKAANGTAKRKIENAASSSSESDAEVNIIRRQTLAALYQKMGALTDSLSPNDHSERLISVAKAVREIAEAAQLLKQY
ncbi:hypothetical protein PHMEG_000956 [Phytophthora megakarya]|uniref:Uncharacterized protein n=1 Tax=Phytophthora megakarya TaxID=4795 RepID=A0A225X1Q5_9STRA|nr:hypothetical protein PHMEG_000956 [Phytophthora megakarya]